MDFSAAGYGFAGRVFHTDCSAGPVCREEPANHVWRGSNRRTRPGMKIRLTSRIFCTDRPAAPVRGRNPAFPVHTPLSGFHPDLQTGVRRVRVQGIPSGIRRTPSASNRRGTAAGYASIIPQVFHDFNVHTVCIQQIFFRYNLCRLAK